MITEIYEFWLFWSKNGRFVTHICFPKKEALKPLFLWCFFGARFLGQGVKKREILKSHPKKKNLTDNWKAKFWVFLLFFLGFFFSCCFFFSFVFFVSFFVFVFFFGGLKGQVRWPEGPPHLALNPPSLFFFLFLVVFLFFVFWRVKGQVRWPKGPPHLALNPPYLFLLLFCFVFCFCFFVLFLVV